MIRSRLATLIASLALVVALAACHPSPAPVHPDASDAAPVTSCTAACAHLTAIPCPVSMDTCVTACRRVAAHAPGYPGCVASVATCHAADACDTGH